MFLAVVCENGRKSSADLLCGGSKKYHYRDHVLS